jgi:hypothetical protein
VNKVHGIENRRDRNKRFSIIMPVVGHQITKIVGKRGEPEKNLKVGSNVELKDVRKRDIFVAGDKKSALDFEFQFTIKYGEKAGGIDITGILFYTGDKAELDKLDKEWAKNKKLDTTMVLNILNRGMEIGYLEAIPLAERLKLPPPIKLPRFIQDEKK